MGLVKLKLFWLMILFLYNTAKHQSTIEAFELFTTSIPTNTPASRITEMEDLHYQYCPITPRCSRFPEIILPGLNGTFPVFPPLIESMCCQDCSCSQNCSEYGTCCPDRLTSLPIQDRPVPLCQRPQLLEYGSKINTGYGENVIVHCSPNFTDPDTRGRCLGNIGDHLLQSYKTVTDRLTGDVYKNRYCAECNFVKENDFVYWQANLECYRYLFLPQNEKMLFEGLTENDRCNVIFTPPPDYVYKKCRDPYVSRCNVTGKWVKHDQLIEDACRAYTSIYNNTYRNVFCYMCNHIEEPQVECEIMAKPSDVVSFSALLNFADDSGLSTTSSLEVPETSCNSNQVYDAYKERCADITCSRTRYLVDGTCKEIFQDVTGYCYDVMLKVTSINSTSFDDITWIGEALKMYTNTYLVSKGIHTFRYIQNVYYYNSSSEVDHISYFLLNFKISVTEKFSMNFSDELLLLDESMHTIYHGKQSKQVWFQAVNFQKINTVFQDPVDATNLTLYYTDGFPLPYCFEGSVIVLTKLVSCPRVQLRKDEYDIEENITGLQIRDMDLFFYRYEYESTEGKYGFYVCVDDYIDRAKELGKINSGQGLGSKPTASAYLSVVATTISIVCLVVTLSVYAMFPVLRTQPGKNNMMLAVSLICAQSMFQFAIGNKQSILYWGCQVIGVLIHFLWLNVLFCMNACCIHMFLVFSSSSRARPISGGKYTIKYILYGLLASSVPVTINIVVVLVQSEGEEIGYAEGILCFISSPLMLGLTFALPVGLVIMTNLILFCIVLVQVSRMPAVDKDVKNKRNYLLIYAKLSTLTGITWIFGFIFAFTGTAAVEYIFIIFSGGQGFFIMIAFVCNKRVLNLLRKKITGVRLAENDTFNALQRISETKKTTVS